MSEVFNEDRRAWQWVTAESAKASPTIVPAPASRHEPFPLTDLQRAYWLGRADYFELGNIGCHVYVEIELPGVDRRRLRAAWQKLINRHEMLRAIIRDDGLQQILPHTQPYDISHLDLRDADQSTADFELAAIRDRMSHQVFSPDRWPLFEVRSTELKDRTLLHFSGDLLFIDVWSLQILHGELIQLAYQRTARVAPLEISFRDYVLSAAQQRDSKSYRRAEEYWLRRLDTLPPAPKLPLAKSPAAITQPRFRRREAMLDDEVWRKLKNRSAKARTSLSGTLLAAFASFIGIDSLVIQFLIFAGVSIALTAASRTIFINYFSRDKTEQGLRSGVDSLPGKVGTVVSSSKGAMNEGAVKVFGSTWTAYPAPGEQPLEAGERVCVESVEGASIYVRRVGSEPDWRPKSLPEVRQD